jgi:predicted dehydrogenase
MAGAWLKPAAAHPQLKIVGLADINLAAAEKRGAEFAPDAATGTDAAALIAELKPDIVFNCTIPEAHHPVSMAALRAGAHVLTEKPLANTMDEAKELVSEAAKTERLFAVLQNYRYRASVRAVKDALDAGWIGEITGAYCDFFIGAHFGGFRVAMDHVLLLDMSIHHFDLSRFFCGSAQPRSVYCEEWNPPGSWYRHGANAQAIFRLGDNIVFNYCGSWCAEGAQTGWNGAWRFTGTRGTLSWDGADEIQVETAVGKEGFLRELARAKVEVRPRPGKDGDHGSIISEFLDCLRDGKTPETLGADNVHSLAMVFGAVESAETKSVFHFPA